MRIRSHLLLLAVCVLVPGLVGAGVAIEKVREAAREAALRGLQETVRATALLVDGQVQRSIGALEALGHSSALATGDLHSFYVEAHAVDQPPDVWTLLLDETGAQVLNTVVPFGTPPPPAASLERVQKVLSSGRPLVSDLIVGPVTKRLVTTVYVAAGASSPTGRYVVAQAFSVDHWKKTTLAPQDRDGWVIGVLDRAGGFISRSHRADELLGQLARPELVAAAAGASEGLIRHHTLEGTDVYDAFAHSALTGWTVAVAAPVDSIEASARQAATTLAIGLLVALVAGAGSGIYLGRALLGAVDRASVAAQALGVGHIPPDASSSVTELHALQQSISDAGRILAAERSGRALAEEERTQLLISEREARALAERQNAAKDRFLAMLAHELRNPLAAISGATEVLVRRGPTDDDRRFLEIVQRQNRHLARIVDDLLDTSRMLSGKVALKMKPTNLGAIVREGAEAIGAAQAAPAVDLQVETEDVWINGDPVRIEQVFSNLVANAIKFSPSGSQVRIVVRSRGDDAVLEVSDRGPGIPSALLPHIFEPFVQGPSPPGRMPSGLGIGLALVKQIVALHGGAVVVGSHGDGPGATFSVLFERIVPPKIAESARPTRSHEARVLLVEDNDDARDAVAALLRTHGFEVVEARDGEEALESAVRSRPDVVVMDLDLPGQSGLDVARAIRARPELSDLRLVALSGHGQESDKADTRSAGFDVHLVKPASPDALVGAIEALVAR